jgi:hypothetical protein
MNLKYVLPYAVPYFTRMYGFNLDVKIGVPSVTVLFAEGMVRLWIL